MGGRACGTDLCVLDSGTAVKQQNMVHADVELFLRECHKLHNFENMVGEPECQGYVQTNSMGPSPFAALCAG